MGCLLRYLFQKVAQIIGSVKLLRQCDDIAALACAKIIPEVQVRVHLERRFALLSERRLVPKVAALLFYGVVPQAVQIVGNAYLLYIGYCHSFFSFWMNMFFSFRPYIFTEYGL